MSHEADVTDGTVHRGASGTTSTGGTDRELVLRALDEQRLLQLTYTAGKARVVQPHAILRKSDGTEILEAYQIRGHSESGIEHGWRHFDLTRIRDLSLLAEHFEPRRDFQPRSGASGVVIAEVRRG
jgi:predicted DNA-binding transcriptional regulator YafY